ncbi:hypothetical protein H072_9765 [Dactylellina haptotyla CBS 200.50]|uniref:Uncharacterized protein n=1 Tax=Dactylellina haptotyla (strain CBS 200.50) TaxID=1284197 RepID=S8A698_DACHA|nr:hypothetical protein H072_9765 [Dactylellina haptotyla CBS 200.50]
MVSFPLTRGHHLHLHHHHHSQPNHKLHKKQPVPEKEDTAAQKVLKTPEFVETIIYLAHANDDSHGVSQKLHKLRLVSKAWLSVVDSSAKLRHLAYSPPKVQSGGNCFGVCHDYLDEIANAMKTVHYLKGEKSRHIGLRELNHCAHVIARRSAASNIDIAEPSVQRLYLFFEGKASTDWMSDLRVFTENRPHDINRSDGANIAYYYNISNTDGIKLEEVVFSLVNIIRVFYSFEEDFVLDKVALEYYNSSWEPDHTLPSYYRDDFDIVSYLWSPYGVPIGRRGLRYKANHILGSLPFVSHAEPLPATPTKRSQVVNLPRLHRNHSKRRFKRSHPLNSSTYGLGQSSTNSSLYTLAESANSSMHTLSMTPTNDSEHTLSLTATNDSTHSFAQTLTHNSAYNLSHSLPDESADEFARFLAQVDSLVEAGMVH